MFQKDSRIFAVKPHPPFPDIPLPVSFIFIRVLATIFSRYFRNISNGFFHDFYDMPLVVLLLQIDLIRN